MKRDFEEVLPTVETTTILSAVVGSRAHGTETAASDTDIRAVFVYPTSAIVSLYEYPEVVRNLDTTAKDWEIARFLNLALDCNPYALEVFSAVPQLRTSEGDELLSLFPHVLWRQRVFECYKGFAANQKTLIATVGKTTYLRPKTMAHYLRVLYNGVELLRQGKMTFRIVDTEVGQMVLDTKFGLHSVDEVFAYGRKLREWLDDAYATSTLPEKPDKPLVNDFLVRVRKAHW